MRLLTGIVIVSMAAVLCGQQAIASDTSALYSGRAYQLGSSGKNYGYGQHYKKPSSVNIGFWTEAGVYTNSNGTGLDRTGWGHLPSERFVQSSGNSALLGNLQNPKFSMNQMGLFLEKKMDTTCGFDWGFKTQMLFGTDAYMTQSREDFWLDHDWRGGDYYTSVSDMYVTAGYGKLGLKAGKFASPLGYEYSESPNNFFYSHSYAFLQTPNTHSGMVADYQISCPLSVFAGWTTGNDAGFANRFGDSAVLAGVRTKLWQGGTLSYTMQYAELHGGEYNGDTRFSKMYNDYLADDEDLNAYYHSLVFSQNLGCWNYAAEWFLMKASNYSDALIIARGNDDSYSRYGITQYLTYKLNCKVGVGFRGEWMRDSDEDADLYAITFGANWTPVQCLVVRPEIRYDWCNSGGFADYFNNWNDSEQLSGGVSVMYKF
jgi:hypothetical protein